MCFYATTHTIQHSGLKVHSFLSIIPSQKRLLLQHIPHYGLWQNDEVHKQKEREVALNLNIMLHPAYQCFQSHFVRYSNAKVLFILWNGGGSKFKLAVTFMFFFFSGLATIKRCEWPVSFMEHFIWMLMFFKLMLVSFCITETCSHTHLVHCTQTKQNKKKTFWPF